MDVACEFYFRTWTFKGERIMISRCEVGPTEAAIGFSEVGRALLTNTDPPHEAKGPDKSRTDDPLSPLHRLVPKPPASISLTKTHPPMSPYCTVHIHTYFVRVLLLYLITSLPAYLFPVAPVSSPRPREPHPLRRDAITTPCL